jgi:hypothetical protein
VILMLAVLAIPRGLLPTAGAALARIRGLRGEGA